MEEKEIIEGNKLIAEFMGMTYEPAKELVYDNVLQEPPYSQSERWLIPNGNITAIWYHLYYLEKWDWLMPVVEKIDNMDATATSITNVCCEVFSKYFKEKDIWQTQNIARPKIEAVWLSVVNFIKWYNQNNQK